MKARPILFTFPLLLLLGGCLEPMPFDHPGYPRNRNSLRYPPGYNNAPRVNQPNAPRDGNYQRSPWDRPPNTRDPRDSGYGVRPGQEPPRENLLPKPEPTPPPRKPEDKPLVEIDPIEEAAKPTFDYAIPVQGAPNLVVSPYSKEGPYIDVNGLSSGTQIECPKTKKTILVP